MFTTILLLVCIGVFLYVSYKYAVDRPEGYPRGPPKIPFFGSLLFMMMIDRRYMHKAVLKFSKWYKSDLVGWHAGPLPVVTVHNYETIREVLNNPIFDGREISYSIKIRDPNNKDGSSVGIFFQDGEIWKEQRRFIIRYLRDYGFGRRFNDLEMVIQEQLSDMIDLIRGGPKYEHEKPYVKEGGYRVKLPYFFNLYSGNSFFYLLFNEIRPRSEQAVLWEIARLSVQFQLSHLSYGDMIDLMPWLRFLFPNVSGYNKKMESNRFLYKYFHDLVQRHIKTYDESYDRNFLDLYIREMKKAEAEGDKNTSFTMDQFLLSILDFSFPSFSIIGQQLAFMAQYLLHYPEVQKKIQKEIDDVVGTGRLPTLDDRKSLHYTEAALREMMRFQSIVPTNLNHRALEDTELCGYKIPKNTLVMISFYASNGDKRVWGDPENLRPERFLDDEGKLCPRNDFSYPFSAGKRLCPAETFSRNMLFLVMSAMCQNFNFVLGPNDKLPDLNAPICGISMSPKDFWIQLEERKH